MLACLYCMDGPCYEWFECSYKQVIWDIAVIWNVIFVFDIIAIFSYSIEVGDAPRWVIWMKRMITYMMTRAVVPAVICQKPWSIWFLRGPSFNPGVVNLGRGGGGEPFPNVLPFKKKKNVRVDDIINVFSKSYTKERRVNANGVNGRNKI